MKGYYDEDRALVAEIKRAVAGSDDVAGFKTVECSIMELADDIVDSTYDLEDDFKAGFLSLLGLLSLDGEVYEAAAADIRERIEKPYPERAGTRVDGLDVRELPRGIVDDMLFGSDAETDGYLDDPGCGIGEKKFRAGVEVQAVPPPRGRRLPPRRIHVGPGAAVPLRGRGRPAAGLSAAPWGPSGSTSAPSSTSRR